jgi:hypothetical protein
VERFAGVVLVVVGWQLWHRTPRAAAGLAFHS